MALASLAFGTVVLTGTAHAVEDYPPLGEVVTGGPSSAPNVIVADPGSSSPSFAVTGGDIVQLTAVGAGLIVVGASLARRRKTTLA